MLDQLVQHALRQVIEGGGAAKFGRTFGAPGAHVQFVQLLHAWTIRRKNQADKGILATGGKSSACRSDSVSWSDSGGGMHSRRNAAPRREPAGCGGGSADQDVQALISGRGRLTPKAPSAVDSSCTTLWPEPGAL